MPLENTVLLYECTLDDCGELALLNRELIEDEGSDNTMSVSELETRARHFLQTDARAFFFKIGEETVGYALVRTKDEPMYLRQFFICRQYRRQGCGHTSFRLLLTTLGISEIDIDVLSGNKIGIAFWLSVGFQARHSVISMRYTG